MRTITASFLNSIANDPDVRPFLGKTGELDLTPIVSDPNNYCFVCAQGGFVGIRLEPGIYELHTVFRPGDAKAVLALAETSLRFMFIQTDCVELKTKVPLSNVRARVLAVKGGLARVFDRKASWEGPDGQMQDVEYFSLGIDRWALLDKFNREAGASYFLDGLDDYARDSYLGAALQMIVSGNPIKGAHFYNRWAAFTESAPLSLLGINPLVFAMNGKTFQVNGNKVEAL